MGKVVTGKGLQDFISTGKVEDIKPDKAPEKAPEAPKLEVVKDKPIVDVGVKEPPKEPIKPADDDIYAEEDQETKEEIAKAKRFDALMRKKHRQMKEAQEAAEENDRLAESQFNRARLAEQKLAETEAELNKLRTQAPPKEPEKKVKPDPQKYMDDKGQFKAFEYAEDLAAWSAEQKLAEYQANQEKQRRDAEAAEAFKKAEARIAESIKRHPDYKEVLAAASEVKTHQAVLEYLSASDSIGEVSYYMATHPEFVERINKLHPLKAIAEVGKLELTFEKPPEPAKQDLATPPRAVSGAPAPIVPLEMSGTEGVVTDPAKMGFKQLRAYEKERRKKR